MEGSFGRKFLLIFKTHGSFAIYARHSQKHMMIVHSVVHKVNVSEFQNTQFERLNLVLYKSMF